MLAGAQMRIGVLGVVLLMAAVALRLAPLDPGSAGAATQTVSVEDYQFAPQVITINAGDSVEWDWTGFANHTVTSDDQVSFDSGILRRLELNTPGPTFTHTFTAGGTFRYYCLVHSGPGLPVPGPGMNGIVVVVGPTVTPAPSVTSSATPTATETGLAIATGTVLPAATPSPDISVTPAGTTIISPTATPAAGGPGARVRLPNAGASGRTGRGDVAAASSGALAIAGSALLLGASGVMRWGKLRRPK